MSVQVSTTITLTAGAATIDLTSIGGVSGSGLKVAFFLFKPLGANSMTVAQGASNAYNLGSAANAFTVQPGGELQVQGGGGLPTVSATIKNIAVTGTGTQQAEVVVGFA